MESSDTSQNQHLPSERKTRNRIFLGALGHHDHIAFCAADRDDVDTVYREFLLPQSNEGHCRIEDAPCDCPEYGKKYCAIFVFGLDGLKYEFLNNPNQLVIAQPGKA